MPRLRLFVAVEVPDAVRAAVARAAAPLRDEAPDAKWTEPEQWHLTLAFLGWVEEERVAAAEQACGAAAGEIGPFDLGLDGGGGTFGRRVLWAGLEDSAELAALAGRLRSELVSAGFEVEDRPFRAHLTLARARKGGRLPPGLGYEGPALRWTVDRLVLMRSQLSRSGSRYAVLGTWGLSSEGGNPHVDAPPSDKPPV